MDLEDLRNLVDYHYWARDRLLAAVEALTPEEFLRDMGNSFPSVRDTLTHIFSAEAVWLSRWQGYSPPAMIPADTFPDLPSIRDAWIQNESKMRGFLEGLSAEGVHAVIEYKSLAGQSSASVLWHMLQHVINHACYHRGQVTTMIRQLGAVPPKTMDLINFYRERQAAGQ